MELVFYRPIKLALTIHCIFSIACLVSGFVFFAGYLRAGLIILGIYFLGFAAFQAIKGKNKISTLGRNYLRFNIDKKTEIPIDLNNIESMSITAIDKFIPNHLCHPNKVRIFLAAIGRRSGVPAAASGKAAFAPFWPGPSWNTVRQV